MEPRDITAAAAVVISFCALVIAWRSYRQSGRAFALAAEDHAEKRLPVKPYLIDAFTFVCHRARYCAFVVSYTNQSSAPQSLATIELEVEFVDQEEISGKAITPATGEVSPPHMTPDFKKLNVPLNLGPRATDSGWIVFKIPSSSNRKFRVNSYRVKGRTSDGRETDIEAFLLRHVTDEEHSL